MAANPPADGRELGERARARVSGDLLDVGHRALRRRDVPGEPPWLVDLLLGLDAQLRHVERNLSWYFSPNTHLLGEALALYVCGRTWPELTDAAEWARIGGDILVGEIDRQVLADGFHAERSTHYHRYALDFYLLALATARAHRTTPVARAGLRADVADRMATALRHVTDAAGRVPLIGDDDGGELFPIAGHAPDDVRPTLAWAAVAARSAGARDRSCARGRAVADGGSRRGEAARAAAAPGDAERLRRFSDRVATTCPAATTSLLVFDAGAHGFMNGGHAHADALAVTLSAGAAPPAGRSRHRHLHDGSRAAGPAALERSCTTR